MVFDDMEKNAPDAPKIGTLSDDLPPEPSVIAEGAAEDTTQEPATGLEETEVIDDSVDRDDDISGVELKEFAKREDLTVDQVWRQIRAGQLVARTENGFVYVYSLSEADMSQENQNRIHKIIAEEGLPPLPAVAELSSEKLPVMREIPSQPVAEIALLLDHLTVAKEESKQVLRLSQESINRITEMSEAIVKAKDEVISQQDKSLVLKEEKLSERTNEVEALKAELADQADANRKLRQQVEDLEMLTKTLGGEL